MWEAMGFSPQKNGSAKSDEKDSLLEANCKNNKKVCLQKWHRNGVIYTVGEEHVACSSA